MSAPVDQAAFGLGPGDPLLVTATLWRGAMIERFSGIESFVDRTLTLLAERGLASASDASNHLSRKRIETLLKTIERADFPHQGAAVRHTLAKIIARWEMRNAICHGTSSVTKSALTIKWKRFDRGGTIDALTWTLPQLLEALCELDKTRKDLGSQLGTIDKACRDGVIQPL